MLCARLCWGEMQPGVRQLPFNIPTAAGDQPRSRSPLLVGSLPAQAQGLLPPSKAGAVWDPPGHAAGRWVSLSCRLDKSLGAPGPSPGRATSVPPPTHTHTHTHGGQRAGMGRAHGKVNFNGLLPMLQRLTHGQTGRNYTGVVKTPTSLGF